MLWVIAIWLSRKERDAGAWRIGVMPHKSDKYMAKSLAKLCGMSGRSVGSRLGLCVSTACQNGTAACGPLDKLQFSSSDYDSI